MSVFFVSVEMSDIAHCKGQWKHIKYVTNVGFNLQIKWTKSGAGFALFVQLPPAITEKASPNWRVSIANFALWDRSVVAIVTSMPLSVRLLISSITKTVMKLVR